MSHEGCQRCGQENVASASGKVADAFILTWPGGKTQEGYVPPNGVCGLRAGDSHDYMELDYCMACGQIQGSWPLASVVKNLPVRKFEFALLFGYGEWQTLMPTQAKTEDEAWARIRRIVEGMPGDGVVGICLMRVSDVEDET